MGAFMDKKAKSGLLSDLAFYRNYNLLITFLEILQHSSPTH